jgi:hypothetical protein
MIPMGSELTSEREEEEGARSHDRDDPVASDSLANSLFFIEFPDDEDSFFKSTEKEENLSSGSFGM